eukprot:CAMPEP_0194200094 /NCGR_PEP_ID=MMETSP0156-20130528/855_1 /TAXON_ID=33649 /ORGANISM="Thalassionema nitzschioides, Strain L26-B" /LENGTH=328 /DNA_ID=CAMNT_0038925061 /DNA_START=196 /DNA_END=1182 /DNA_ORIENTATION=+
MKALLTTSFLSVLLLAKSVDGFLVTRSALKHQSVVKAVDVLNESYTLSPGEVKPILRFGKGNKVKIVNSFGLLTLAVSLATGPIWMLAMMIVEKISEMDENFDPNRAIFDHTGKIWSRVWLTMTSSYPTISGDVDGIRERKGSCLYVANHASWLDIPILCTVLDPVFKFIAKSELEQVPCIGQQLKGGNHILIDRDDRRSQLRTFKEGISWLKKGIPLMAFPEGARSEDGRLMSFKGGIFSMATKAKVPIVPISLSHTHAVMPANSLFPVQPGNRKLHVYVHEPIDPNGKTDDELAVLVQEALLSQMPREQHPLINSAEEKTVEKVST